MAEVEVRGLTKYFGDRLGLEDVTLAIGEGELFVILGPTGAGKSTLLWLLAGIEEPTEGDIHIGGRSVLGVAPKDRHVGLLFPNYALTPDATVFDNIAIPLRLQQVPAEETEQRVNTVAERLGLRLLLSRTAAGLSVGQSYLVALARAFVAGPQLLLMDNPLANLEPKARARALPQLAGWQRALAITTVYSTADEAAARQIADRIAVLRAGRLQQVGTPQELYDRPANRFVATFIGRPPMNMLEATVVAWGQQMHLDIGTANLPVPGELAPALAEREGQPVVLGIRPEDVFDRRTAPAKMAGTHSVVPAQVVRVDETEPGHLLLLTTTQDRFAALSTADLVPQPGESLEVVFDLARIHLFDRDTGKRLAPPTRPE